MQKSYHIINLDTGAGYTFLAMSPMDAMQKLRYTLSLKYGYLKNKPIDKTISGHVLYFETIDGIWAVSNWGLTK